MRVFEVTDKQEQVVTYTIEVPMDEKARFRRQPLDIVDLFWNLYELSMALDYEAKQREEERANEVEQSTSNED